MKKTDHLNGLKAWWNRLAKEPYRIKLTADELKSECYSEWENTGSVEMRSYQSKDGRPHIFVGR